MILRRYINSEILKTSLAILVILVLLFVSSRFLKYIQLAVDGTISSSAAFYLMALNIPAVTGFLLPMSFFIAALTTMGRLYAENEMAIIHNAGLSDYQIARNILPLATIIALVSAALSFALNPWANYEAKQVSAREGAQIQLGGAIEGRFQETRDKNGVIFIERKGEYGQIHKLFTVSGLDSTDDSFTLQVAKRGYLEQSVDDNSSALQSATMLSNPERKTTDYLVLKDGVNYQFDRNLGRWQITEYESYYMPVKRVELETVERPLRTLSTIDLIADDSIEGSAELHWRLSAPISVFIVTFMAIPLARTQPRKGKFSRLFPAIMVYMVYALFMMNGRQLIETGKVPAVLGFWWIHALAVAYTYWIYKRGSKLKPNKKKVKLRKLAHG
ncbi:LPS export ABC transporter permease LptF [Aliikangiella sp. G2MR2-5]|uniref:LPS export ABC transporter permease LptF n=1 Tax=Aliikangiella sp. G2MR2-5 TaxID=2788943 RepID=UPI0018A9651F|nr:LPS export ABC transporter permease LptF [Aliikangiella sp. G2MR2-5]